MRKKTLLAWMAGLCMTSVAGTAVVMANVGLLDSSTRTGPVGTLSPVDTPPVPPTPSGYVTTSDAGNSIAADAVGSPGENPERNDPSVVDASPVVDGHQYSTLDNRELDGGDEDD